MRVLRIRYNFGLDVVVLVGRAMFIPIGMGESVGVYYYSSVLIHPMGNPTRMSRLVK